MFQWCMYYLSCVPLWISIIFIDTMSLIHGTVSYKTEVISIVLIVVGFMIALGLVHRRLNPVKIGAERFRLKEATEEKFITAEFLATYIIPLFAFDFKTWEGVVLFGIYFFVFGWLCVYHNYLCTNIMLEILKYKTYSCIVIDDNKIEIVKKVISKKNLRLFQGESIYIKGLNNDYSFECFVEKDIDIQG